MRRELMARLALGSAGIFIGGSLMGLALANYADSGSFHFYRAASERAWTAKASQVRPIDFAAETSWLASPDTGLLQRAAFER
ncbi:hypothetical protein ACMGDH_09630 [Sphingomonas sp. DT-207]|uniref:hypothetical protein n=1 Tax=Sphingomonas sp. DT-207 TaxID=3396167 RepID=UPI003F1C68E2